MLTSAQARNPFPNALIVVYVALTVYLAWFQSYYWRVSEEHAFGWLVPLFAGFVLHDRWEQICTGFSSPAGDVRSSAVFLNVANVLAILAVHFGLLAYGFGGFMRIIEGPSARTVFIISSGYCLTLLAVLFLASRQDAQGNARGLRERFNLTGLFLFPVLIWLIAAPLLPDIEMALQLFMLNKVVGIVSTITDFMALPITRVGNLLTFPGGEVGVTEACSGINSFTACVFAGTFLAATFLSRMTRKVALIVLAVLMAFGMNVVRSLFLTLWAYHYGPDAIEGTVHDIAGYAVLGVVSVLLLLICMMITHLERLLDPRAEPPTPPKPANSSEQDQG